MESALDKNDEEMCDLHDHIRTIVNELVDQIQTENKTDETEGSEDNYDACDAVKNISTVSMLTSELDAISFCQNVDTQSLHSEASNASDNVTDEKYGGGCFETSCNFKPEEQENELNCEKCLDKTKSILETCQFCCIYLCSYCIRGHDCQAHILNPLPHECEPCKVMGNSKGAAVKCVDCDESLCESCQSVHRTQKATRFHKFTEIIFEKNCDCCFDRYEKKIPASGRCQECDECYCDDCLRVHLAQKATRCHTIIDLKTERNTDINLCEPCKINGISKESVFNCLHCKELLCKGCSKLHRSSKFTRSHKLSASSKQIQPQMGIGQREGDVENILKLQHESTKKIEYAQNTSSSYMENKQDKHQTGKPKAAGVTVDSITLVWDNPEQLLDDYHFQIRYKTVKDGDETDKWKFYEEQPTVSSVELTGLKSDTDYIFQIRMIKDDHEECYSERSDIIHTMKSAATTVTVLAKEIQLPDVTMPVKKVPMLQDFEGRSEEGKTRKLTIGTKSTNFGQEKTILLVGATGSGKSTLIDGMINYILGVTWDDPYRLSMIDLEKEEQLIQTNQAESQTQWITNYTVNVIPGSRLDYALNIIDTPGFGDTRGIDRDKEIVDQIRILFSATDSTGIAHLDAVCFVIKAPDARLTASQKYVFDSLLSIFGKDIESNICIFVTFADGKRPPVISALKAASLPNELYFTLNNSGLFANNIGPNMTAMSPIFWEMGVKSFGKFFNHLEELETKSLRQTKEVLNERKEVELTVENLIPIVESGLHKLEELRFEIQIITQHELDIKANENFTYVVQETRQVKRSLPPGRCVTNCLICNMTCHKKCRIWNDDKKYRCSAMDRDTGQCTQCFEDCDWEQHANASYIFEYEQVPVTKTYAEKLEKYKQAESEKITHEQVIQRMIDELDTYGDTILEKLEKLNKCNTRLKEIALRPNPLDTDGYIDVLIESEKNDMKPGFQLRIQALYNFKKKADVNNDVSRFYDTLYGTNDSILSYEIVDISKLKKKQKGWFPMLRK